VSAKNLCGQQFFSVSQPFSTSAPLLVAPKQSSAPYHWLTPGYCTDEVKTNVFLSRFTTTYVTFPAPSEIDFSTPG